MKNKKKKKKRPIFEKNEKNGFLTRPFTLFANFLAQNFINRTSKKVTQSVWKKDQWFERCFSRRVRILQNHSIIFAR
jgi:hypothetical protein